MTMIGRAPARAALLNLATNELRPFRMNPAELPVNITVNWGKVAGMGADFEWLHYHHTASPTFALELHQYRMAMVEQRHHGRSSLTASDVEEVREQYESDRRFLLSLCYPQGRQNDLVKRSPPPCLLLWPKLLAVKVVVESLAIKDTLFARDGSSLEFVANLGLIESRTYRLTSEDVARVGLLRESTR
jgi:hypothetical protein